jgi:hypothetical protein
MPDDALGKFQIPHNLLEKSQEARARLREREAQERADEASVAAQAKRMADASDAQDVPFTGGEKAPVGWTFIKKVKGTPGKNGARPQHTIEYMRNLFGDVKLRCTCQGFKIGKKGSCKHTDAIDVDTLP